MAGEDDQAVLRNRGRGTAKVGGGHLWDAFYDAPPARPGEDQVALEDAQDCILKLQDTSEVETTADGEGPETLEPNSHAMQRITDGDAWRNVLGPDGKLQDERVSHLMCRVLRYHADSMNLAVDEEGFVGVADLLAAIPELENSTEEDVRRVVKDSVSAKGARFELRDFEGENGMIEARIRATYRHPKDGRKLLGDRRGPRGRPPWAMVSYGKGGPPPAWNLPVGSFASGNYPRPGFSRLPLEPAAVADGASSSGDDRGEVRDQTWEASSASRQTAASKPAVPQITSNPVVPQAAVAMSDSQSNAAASRGLSTAAAIANAAAPAAQSAEPEVEEEEERWELYHEPGTDRVWFWNEVTEEVFYADDPKSGWERFEDSEGRPWWWHDVSGRFFFEEQ